MITERELTLRAAERLERAATSAQPTEPVRDILGSTDLAAAYRVQQELVGRRLAAGRRIVGHKVGLTSPSVQQQLGVDQPDFGVLFDDMAFADGDTVPISRLMQPKIEAEVAFVLGADLDGELGRDQVRAAVDYSVAALEIVDSRIADWDITIVDTVADNASSGLYVLGFRPLTLDDLEPREVTMSMSINDQVVSEGNGRACLGDPLEALAWVARTAQQMGAPLRAGEVILSGALGPMSPVSAGDRVVADLGQLGQVTVTFSKENS